MMLCGTYDDAWCESTRRNEENWTQLLSVSGGVPTQAFCEKFWICINMVAFHISRIVIVINHNSSSCISVVLSVLCLFYSHLRTAGCCDADSRQPEPDQPHKTRKPRAYSLHSLVFAACDRPWCNSVSILMVKIRKSWYILSLCDIPWLRLLREWKGNEMRAFFSFWTHYSYSYDLARHFHQNKSCEVFEPATQRNLWLISQQYWLASSIDWATYNKATVWFCVWLKSGAVKSIGVQKADYRLIWV